MMISVTILYILVLCSSSIVTQCEEDYTSMYLSQFPREDYPEEILEEMFKSRPSSQISSSDIEMIFYSKNETDGYKINISNIEEFKRTDYSSSKYTVFVIHGWTNDYTYIMPQTVKNAYLAAADLNVFLVDWSKIAKQDYVQSRNQVIQVGQVIGTMIRSMVGNNLLDLSRTSVIGHSLGAHVAGTTGKALAGELSYIVGLDPAGPLFFMKIPFDRLDSKDAKFVQVIHTCAGKLGFDGNLGNSDYWANGGHNQPGCLYDDVGNCAHARSYFYYAESLQSGKFNSWQCDSYDHFRSGDCIQHAKSYLGQMIIDKEASGSYYLETNSESPYAKGDKIFNGQDYNN